MLTANSRITPNDTLMFKEAASSPAVIATQFKRNHETVKALADELRRNPPPFAVTCARGSSDHAAYYAKTLFGTQLGIVTASLSPSINSIYNARLKLKGALYLSISQSGQSPDLLRNAEAAKASGARVVALVNAEDSPLAQLADTMIPLAAGAEKSVAASKSYLASLAAILQLSAYWSRDSALTDALDALPHALTRAWECDWQALGDGLLGAHNLFVLGRGPGLAAAREAALKFKETCGLHAESYSAAEVKHGPMALVGQDFPVLALTQPDASAASTRAVCEEFAARGARVWRAGEDGDLPTAPSPHVLCAPLLQVQTLYRAINTLALRRGYHPDTPVHLNKVTQTL